MTSFLSQIIDVGHFTPHFAFIYLFIHTLFTQHPLYLYITLVSFVDYSIIGPLFKTVSTKYNLSSPRPLYPNMNGMPSGHTQLMWLLFVFFRSNNDKFHTFLFGCLALFTSQQRMYSGMHSPRQVLVGFCLGIILGYFWYLGFAIIGN